MAFLPIVGPIMALISKFIPDATVKAQAQAELEQLTAGMITAESKSESWITRIARPLNLFYAANIVFMWALYSIFLVPIFGSLGISLPTVLIPTEFWQVYLLMFGIYGGARTVEKVTDSIMNFLAKRGY